MSSSGHRLVRLPNGAWGVHAEAYGETMHSTAGPAAEAEELYVRQIGLAERVAAAGAGGGEFVIWDVGLGAAGNVTAVLRATREVPVRLRVVSFDHAAEPLRFALGHARELGYLEGYEAAAGRLLEAGRVEFRDGAREVAWELHLGDFPALLRGRDSAGWPGPGVVLYDPFSPARNPSMWTAPLLADLYRRLDPGRPCVMPTYSRSTMLRVALLLAGFRVGAGRPSGVKEETTVAANQPGLLEAPLDRRWLERARQSTSAEPLWEAAYRQAPLQPETWARLQAHPQFR
jgi:tRNA U34 5-methylaminomethyl-2-thiouridine-forming methyltransferase MnmC